MYEIPSRGDIRAVRITDKVIAKDEAPVLEPSRLIPRADEDMLARDESA